MCLFLVVEEGQECVNNVKALKCFLMPVAQF